MSWIQFGERVSPLAHTSPRSREIRLHCNCCPSVCACVSVGERERTLRCSKPNALLQHSSLITPSQLVQLHPRERRRRGRVWCVTGEVYRKCGEKRWSGPHGERFFGWFSEWPFSRVDFHPISFSVPRSPHLTRHGRQSSLHTPPTSHLWSFLPSCLPSLPSLSVSLSLPSLCLSLPPLSLFLSPSLVGSFCGAENSGG